MWLFLVPLRWPAVVRQGIVGNSRNSRFGALIPVPCQFPAGAPGREPKFPAMMRRFARKLLVLQDIVPQTEKIFPWFPDRQGKFADVGAGPALSLQHELAGDEELGGPAADAAAGVQRHDLWFYKTELGAVPQPRPI